MAIRHTLFQKLGTKTLLCLVMAFTADWLFYDHPVGWTIGIYSGLVLAIIVLTQRGILRSLPAKIVFTASALLTLQMMNAPSPLAVTLYILGILSLLVSSKRAFITDARFWLKDVFAIFIRTFAQWGFDTFLLNKVSAKRGSRLANILRFAIVPVLLSAIFINLFLQANPILERVWNKIDFTVLWSPGHWLFWTFVATITWGLMRPHIPHRKKEEKAADKKKVSLDVWLNRNSVVLSLIAFNLLFAVQNVMDAVFLWSSDAALPVGMTYSQYARAGAYPLVFTVVIAAIYVLVTFGEGKEHYQSSAARIGVYLWIVQNMFMLASAANRLIQYIDWYSLTQLRLAALIWMAVVAVGIILIVARVYFNKSNTWLVNTNMLFVVCVLYVCCFINFDRFIADYNTQKALVRAADVGYTEYDLRYMISLGPQAIPALKRIEASLKHPHAPNTHATDYLESRLRERLKNNWRAWTWEDARLLQEIDAYKPNIPVIDATQCCQ